MDLLKKKSGKKVTENVRKGLVSSDTSPASSELINDGNEVLKLIREYSSEVTVFK